MSGFLLLVCQTFHTVAVRKVAVSRQRFQRRVDILQNRRLALLAPVQGDHLLVRFDLENIPRQFFEIIEQGPVIADFLPLIDPHARVFCQ